MRKKILFAAFFAITCSDINAQGSYTGVNFTYGFPIGGSVLGNNISENFLANTGTYENVVGTFGTGTTIGSYFGYNLNSNLGFEVGVNYLWGNKYNFKNNTDYGSGSYDNISDEVYSSSFRVSPAIRLGFGEGKFRPYLRGGITFGLFNKIVDNTTEEANYSLVMPADHIEKRFEFSGGTSIGFNGALGLNYSISDKVFVFAEATTYLMSWAPTKGELVKSTLNGTDQLPAMNVSDKQFELVDKLDRPSTVDTNSPTVALKHYFPMSSIGATIGMHLVFGK